MEPTTTPSAVTTPEPRGIPGVAHATAPDGERWAVWRQRLPWRPRTTDVLVNSPEVALEQDRLVYGAVALVLAVAMALVETALLLAALPLWWLVRSVRGRTTSIHVYRSGLYSRTYPCPTADVDRRVEEIVAAIQAGTLDPVQPVTGPRVRRV